MAIGVRSINKKSNDYADAMPDMPKAVLMAILMDFAATGVVVGIPDEIDDGGDECAPGDNRSLRRIAKRWAELHPGVIPQPVSREWKRYL